MMPLIIVFYRIVKIHFSCDSTCRVQRSQSMTDAIYPNFHDEWSHSCLQDLANQTLLPIALPNCTANNFHCDWARWANQATQARQLFSSSCPIGLRCTGTVSFRLSHVCYRFAKCRVSQNKV